MKKNLTRFALLFLLTAALCCVTAMAEGEKGIYQINQESGAVITPQTADETEITAKQIEVNGNTETFYVDAERFGVAYSGLANTSVDCLVWVIEGDTTTLVFEQLVYMDQATPTAGGVAFNAYPMRLTSGCTYSVLLSGGGLDRPTRIATFKFYAPYRLGDVDDNGKLATADARGVLKMLVGKDNNGTPWTETQRLAADADGNGKLATADARLILKALVGKHKFDWQ